MDFKKSILITYNFICNTTILNNTTNYEITRGILVKFNITNPKILLYIILFI
jgi:hypothetical protein